MCVSLLWLPSKAFKATIMGTSDTSKQIWTELHKCTQASDGGYGPGLCRTTVRAREAQPQADGANSGTVMGVANAWVMVK